MKIDIKLIGADNFDEFIISKIQNKLISVKQKYEKIFGNKSLQEFKVNINTKPKGEGRDLHEVTGSIRTTHGLLRSSKNGWDVLNVIDEIKNDLNRQIIDMKEKIKSKRNYPANA